MKTNNIKIMLMVTIMMTLMIYRGSSLPTLGSPTPKSVAPTEGGSVRSGSVLAHYPGHHHHDYHDDLMIIMMLMTA